MSEIPLIRAILSDDVGAVRGMVQHGVEVNFFDEYGYTPLIEAAIMNNTDIATCLLEAGAEVEGNDMTGNTPLHWAVENNNLPLVKMLIKRGADPNAFTLGGQPVLTMPLLRQQTELKRYLMQQGADLNFAQDFINTKLLGHIFELVGTADLINPHNQRLEVDFEGFFLEFSIGLIRDSLSQFQNHYAARKVRHYLDIARLIIQVMDRAARLVKYQQYHTNLMQHQVEIRRHITQEPLLIPVGYEGHAITFIKLGSIFAKCDRREDSRLFDNIMFYQITRMDIATPSFLSDLIYQRKTSEFVNEELHHLLGLVPMTEIKIEAQVSGNCSWANVEAAIPTLFFLASLGLENSEKDIGEYKSAAMHFFRQWRAWNQERSLQFLIQSMRPGESLRNACKAEVLGAILFQHCRIERQADRHRIEAILAVLATPEYGYILENYVKEYVYESRSEEGVAYSHLLKAYHLL